MNLTLRWSITLALWWEWELSIQILYRRDGMTRKFHHLFANFNNLGLPMRYKYLPHCPTLLKLLAQGFAVHYHISLIKLVFYQLGSCHTCKHFFMEIYCCSRSSFHSGTREFCCKFQLLTEEFEDSDIMVPKRDFIQSKNYKSC